MSELLLNVLVGEGSAARALQNLRGGCPAADRVASAATVSVADSGIYSVETTGRAGSSGAVPGMFWDALFVLILVVPVPGSSYGPGAGAMFGALINAGVDETFLMRARAALVPGTSAVALLLRDDLEDEDTRPLREHGTLIAASFSPEQEAELEREFGGPE